jgi:hypothetical protein
MFVSINRPFLSDWLVKSLPGGYGGGKNKRVVNNFVRYPYPKQMHSAYKVHYTKKQANVNKDAFNLEKESKT